MSERNDTGVAPETSPGAREARTAMRGWWLLASLVAGIGLGTTVAIAWHWYRQPARVQAALPARPALTGNPAVLHELIASAQALSASRARALEGAAELGRLYHANGYHREAEACWRLLRAEQPGEARWCHYLADLRHGASDHGEMTRLLEQTVKLAPEYAPAWLKLAEVGFKGGRLDAAEHHYRRRLALLPADPYASLGLARVALQRGDRSEARRLLEQLLREAPEFPSGQNLYAEMLAAEGDAAGARQHRWLGGMAGRFREADDPWLDELNAWCHHPQRLRVLGTIEFQTERGDRGRALMERAVRLAPDDPAGYELLGDLYLKLGDAARARDTLEEGIRLTESATPSPMHFVNLSEAFRMLGQPEEALRAVQHGLGRMSDAFELYNALGVVLSDLGREEDAIAAYREAIDRKPNDADSNFNLAVSLLSLGRRDEAHAHLKRALAGQPGNQKALTLLGRLELEAGRLDAAAEYLRPLYESNPGVPQVRELVARWHLRSGVAAASEKDVSTAEHHFRDGLEMHPEEPELNASLGALYLVQGRFKEALGPLESFHRLKPGNAQSSLFLGQVYARLGRNSEAQRILREGEDIATRAGQSATAAHCREILQFLQQR
ncbi:MAG TPA: tetratricopeptide repeat protein [Opitutaceae bacterium]